MPKLRNLRKGWVGLHWGEPVALTAVLRKLVFSCLDANTLTLSKTCQAVRNVLHTPWLSHHSRLILMTILVGCVFTCVHIDGLVQDCSNSIANALELLQSCTKPPIYFCLCMYYGGNQLVVDGFNSLTDQIIMFVLTQSLVAHWCIGFWIHSDQWD